LCVIYKNNLCLLIWKMLFSVIFFLEVFVWKFSKWLEFEKKIEIERLRRFHNRTFFKLLFETLEPSWVNLAKLISKNFSSLNSFKEKVGILISEIAEIIMRVICNSLDFLMRKLQNSQVLLSKRINNQEIYIWKIWRKLLIKKCFEIFLFDNFFLFRKINHFFFSKNCKK